MSALEDERTQLPLINIQFGFIFFQDQSHNLKHIWQLMIA
jgi:hypothetical protein